MHNPAWGFILLFIVLLFQASGVKAATNTLDFPTVDQITYRCYSEHKWDSVILVGKKALRQNIDYYYLRVRLGVAYFEKHQYFSATTHFVRARKFNSGDPFVTDYLYRSYLFTNRPEEARLLKASIPPDERDSTRSKHGFLEQVHFESGYTLSSDRAPKNLATLMENDSIYGEQDLYGNNIYENLGLKLRISNRVGLTMAYNYLNFSKTKYFQYGRTEAHRDTIIYNIFINDTISRDYLYSYPWKIHDTSFHYHISQHEAYLGATLTLPWGLKVLPAFHWINVSYTKINPSYRTDSVSDTAFYSYIDNTYHLFRYPSLVYSFNETDTSFNNFVAALRISKELGRFSIALAGSWSNLNGKKQKQIGISLTYYPLGNLNFYGTTAVTGFFQGKDKRLLLSQILGAKITPWMWGELNFYYGDYTNANIFNGAIVYNNSDFIDYRGGATMLFAVGKHIQLSLIYQYFRKESQQLYYIKTQDPVTHEINEIPQIKNNPYNTNTIIGGITWKL